jgi:WD40 repeat protein
MSTNFSERLRGIDERCDQYEVAWRARLDPRIEDYLEGVEEVSQRRALWYELVLLDQELRTGTGESRTLEDYQARDPDKAILVELSTDLIPPWQQVGAPTTSAPSAGLIDAHDEAGQGNGSAGFDPEFLAQLALGGGDLDVARTSREDPPSTIGDHENRPKSDEELTVGEDLPSTVFASPEERGVLHELSATDGWKAGESPASVLLPPGMKLGDYELTAKLAQGGMGVVYKARQISLNRIVALKTIKAGAFASDRELRLFQSEAEAIAALDHPGIVPIFEIGEHHGVRFYSMMLIEGQNLHECRERFHGKPRTIAHLVAQIAQAVHHAHLRGVLHRDLKPANILVDGQNQPHVVDWGLAKRLEIDGELASTTSVAGTPCYMAPEQAQGLRHAITTATDVYGLGTILYALLTRRPPFHAGTTLQTLRQVIEQEPRRPRAIDPKIDADLETICLKCLEKDPKKRFSTALELAEDLERWLHGEPINARPASRVERVTKYVRRRPAISGLIVLVHVVGLLGLAGILWQWGAALAARDEALRSEDGALRQAYVAKMNLASRDWSDANIGHVRQLLDSTAPRPGKVDLRGFEWYYLNRLNSLDTLTLTGHNAVVWDVACSPDGTRLASCAEGDRAVRIWDAASGQLIRALADLPNIPYCLAFHPAGMQLAASYRAEGVSKIIVWDLATGQPLRTLNEQSKPISGVAYSPDGKLLAASSDDGTVRILNSPSGQNLKSFLAHPDGARAVKFSPDGQSIVCGTHRGASLWDVASGKEIRRFEGHSQQVTDVAYSPDGKRLASIARDKTVRLWDIATGRNLWVVPAHPTGGLGIAFSGDGTRLASVGFDQMVKLWDAADGREVRTLRGHAGAIYQVRFLPDGKRLVTASQDGTVKLWDADTDQESQTLQGHTATILSAQFSPDGTYIASAGQDRLVKFWDLATRKVIAELPGHTADVNRVRFSPDGRHLASASDDRVVKVWNVATRQVIHSLEGHSDSIFGLAYRHDGHMLATASKDLTIKLWDPDRGALLRTLRGHFGRVWDVAFSPDGKSLASAGDDHTVRFWDAATGKETRKIEEQGLRVTTVAFNPDGTQLAAGGFDPVIKQWDVTTGRLIQDISGHLQGIESLTFSPDGTRLVSAGHDQSIRIWDVTLGQELLALKGHTGIIAAVAFSPDGKRLVSAGEDRAIKLWDTVIDPGRHIH